MAGEVRVENVNILEQTQDFGCGCGGGTTCIDTRPNARGVRRRHACKECGTRFTTMEIRVYEATPDWEIPCVMEVTQDAPA